jgi:hypothetical protein
MSTNQQQAPSHAYWLRNWCAANGIPNTLAYREIAEGRLTTFRIGRRRYVTESASKQYFAARERDSSVKRGAV